MMAVAFYILASVLIAGGGIWWLYECIVIVQLGRYIALIPISVASSYIVLAGALFLAVGAIIQRLDRLVANGRPRSFQRVAFQRDDAPPSSPRHQVDDTPRRSKTDRYFR
jgi:hypothetical protein